MTPNGALLIVAASVALAGGASAEGIMLYGDARLGLGYNIDNDGQPTGDDALRAVSRVRFGVLMAGETESGVTFGADIRADNAVGGEGEQVGQSEGLVFVSGAWGALTFGDTSGADERWVGDLNEVGLTCLSCENETPFISNGGGFGEDELNFANNPEARPTIRYDFTFHGFGLSMSSNRDLTDIGVGGGWEGEIGGGSLAIGAGYYDYASFRTVGPSQMITVIDSDGDPMEIEAESADVEVAAGTQWSAMVGGEFGAFNGTVIYTNAESSGETGFDTLGLGVGAGFGPWALNFYYNNVFDAYGGLDEFDGTRSYGFGVNYDLGGGALAQFGVVNDYGGMNLADFGISMAF